MRRPRFQIVADKRGRGAQRGFVFMHIAGLQDRDHDGSAAQGLQGEKVVPGQSFALGQAQGAELKAVRKERVFRKRGRDLLIAHVRRPSARAPRAGAGSA